MRIERQFSPFKLLIENEKDLNDLTEVLQVARKYYYEKSSLFRNREKTDAYIYKIEDIIRLLES